MTSPNAHDPNAPAALELAGLRVLLVEDSWTVGMAVRSLLRSCGADVVGPAATTADAERLIEDRDPDVALVDISLRDGELAYGMIDRLCDRGIRVVVLSGYADVPLAQGKVAAVLQKPFDEAQLLACLRQK